MRFIPNFLTFIRLTLSGFFLVVETDQYIYLLSLALLTEVLDGFLARLFSWKSDFGRIMDPIADRAVAFSISFGFIIFAHVSWSLMLLAMIRDVVVTIVFVFYFLFQKDKISKLIAPNFFGKLTTAFQYLFFYDILLGSHFFWGLLSSVFLLSLVSLFTYTVRWLGLKNS